MAGRQSVISADPFEKGIESPITVGDSHTGSCPMNRGSLGTALEFSKFTSISILLLLFLILFILFILISFSFETVLSQTGTRGATSRKCDSESNALVEVEFDDFRKVVKLSID